MSRQIDMSKPDTWSDDDKAYLATRGQLPAKYADDPAPAVFPPAQEATSAEVQQLKDFLEAQFPEELGVEGETPVATAMRLLGNFKGYDPNAPVEEADDYDTWKVKELRAEAAERTGYTGDAAKDSREDLITNLRAWDAANPPA
jgi:hypothetical protein